MAETSITCNVFSSIGIGCKDNIGGVKNAWVGSYNGFSFTIDSGHTVTGITTGTTTLYQITPVRTSSSATEAQPENNTNTTFEQTITLVYSKNQVTLRNFVASLAKSITVCVLQDRNNNFWLYGSDNGLQTASDQSTGTNENDPNSWTIKLHSIEQYPALPVSAAAILPFIV
jgi:hypothetical protein